MKVVLVVSKTARTTFLWVCLKTQIPRFVGGEFVSGAKAAITSRLLLLLLLRPKYFGEQIRSARTSSWP